MDYCLQNADEAEFNQLMLDTGLCMEITGYWATTDGKEYTETSVVPADYTILIDRIGPITIGETTYPEYYSNLRLLNGATEDQATALAVYAIDPSQPQYRNWL